MGIFGGARFWWAVTALSTVVSTLKNFPFPEEIRLSATRRELPCLPYGRSNIPWDLDLPAVASLCSEERSILRSQLEKAINTPLTSSMGRLFDAVSALTGVRARVNYEGQAAIELENLCSPDEKAAYSFEIESDKIKLSRFFEQVVFDVQSQVPISIISAKFHNGLARVFTELCQTIRTESGIHTVALSGGVWQNKTLLEKTYTLLDECGFDLLIHHQVPTNDGGIALGQVAIAASIIDT